MSERPKEHAWKACMRENVSWVRIPLPPSFCFFHLYTTEEMKNYLSIQNVSKIYKNKIKALDNVSLDLFKGEIFALLGPNGAGKSTLINIISGIAALTSGKVFVNDFDIVKDFRQARSMIGVVPQELYLEAFETVWDNVCYSRALYGKARDYNYIETLLKTLFLWSKKDHQLRHLSGGMKRRVLIAKALSHRPSVLLLDEPTAGVDVELRKEMWETVKSLREQGVTIILTTHYIEEAEAIADRVGIINHGKIILVDKKEELVKKFGQKQLVIELQEKVRAIPDRLKNFSLYLSQDGTQIIYHYQNKGDIEIITNVLLSIKNIGLPIKDIYTKSSSLESIFIELLKGVNHELLRS